MEFEVQHQIWNLRSNVNSLAVHQLSSIDGFTGYVRFDMDKIYNFFYFEPEP